jgi:hypothetical protein
VIVINHATKSKNRCTGWNKKKGKVQHYAEEEKSLWEDFRHWMMIGTKEFVDRMRSTYMPDNFHNEIPQTS